ncbi:hypothetical protein [Streptomyces heilongjiangensis]|uniref:Resolvase/invertase-type recombinase catalytic domain-containing protein n=1 Tax=Streptomyces heilongjiangensis TaxID=945052 RepID=A0ABW1BEP5_9ACTN
MDRARRGDARLVSMAAELGITVVAIDLGELRARPEEDGNPVPARYQR